MIDSTDEEKLLFAKDEFNRLLQDESLITIPFLMLYNKSDLGDKSRSIEELNVRLEIENARKDREIAVSKCSAINGDGIWEGIDQLITIFEKRKNGAHLFPDLGLE